MTPLEDTLNFCREHDLNVIPLKYGDKKPACKWEEFKTRKISGEEIKKFFAEGKKNIGILGGAISNNLIVMDFDSPELYTTFYLGERPEKTTTVVKTGKGFHVYYRSKSPMRKRAYQLKNNGDGVVSILSLQGEGGYVVAPPSLHPSGKKYEWLSCGEIATAPWDSDECLLARIATAAGSLGMNVEMIDEGGGEVKETPYIAQIKSKIGISDVARKYGHEVVVGGLAKCWMHPDTKPSLSVDRENQKWYCHGCQKGGGVVRLIRLNEGESCTNKRAIEIAKELAGIETREKKEGEEKPLFSSFIELGDGEVCEEFVVEGEVSFIHYRGGLVVGDRNEVSFNGDTYQPIEGKAVELGAVILPGQPEEYGTVLELVDEIAKFIYTYLDVSKNFLEIAKWYVLLSWVGDKVNTVPYLRALGDTGTGKTRFLDVIGRLCYRPLCVSGCVTPAPIYRFIGAWHGTLVLDEADRKRSDETDEVVTILNCGFERGRPVLRCLKDNPEDLQIFETFGPKVFATRRRWKDVALESRCMTEIMLETNREDVPCYLNKQFYEEQNRLINKLFMFRIRNRHKVGEVEPLDLGKVEPRLRQAFSPFAVVISAVPEACASFRKFVEEHQRQIIEERGESFDGEIVQVILELVDRGEKEITPSLIASLIDRGDKKVSPVVVGKRARGLGLSFKKVRIGGKTPHHLILENEKIEILRRRYVSDVPAVPFVSGEPPHGPLDAFGGFDCNNIEKRYYKSGSPGTTGTTGALEHQKTQQEFIISLLNTIKNLTKEAGFATLQTITNHLNEPEARILEGIKQLRHEGEIYEPKPGCWKVV